VTGTQTTTYTVVDIRKVVDKFAADFATMALATGIHDRDYVAKVVTDLKAFAENGCLERVNMILKDASGTQVRAAVYTVSNAAAGWKSDRPGNNLWPPTPGGSLLVVAATKNWNKKTPGEKASFIAQNEMNFTWPATSEDTSFVGLTKTTGQRYESNGYGWERTNFTR
jgi:hypothetical protein